MDNKSTKGNSIVIKIFLLTVVAVVLIYLAFPIFPLFNWLWIDFSSIPSIISSFAFGPLYGIVIESVKSLIIFLIRGSVTGGIGELANFIIGVTFVVTAGIIYSFNKTRRNAVFSMLIATILMVVVAIIANLIILIPLYKNFVVELNNRDFVIKYILFGVLPFNILKGIAVTLITSLLYNKLSILTEGEEIRTLE